MPALPHSVCNRSVIDKNSTCRLKSCDWIFVDRQFGTLKLVIREI